MIGYLTPRSEVTPSDVAAAKGDSYKSVTAISLILMPLTLICMSQRRECISAFFCLIYPTPIVATRKQRWRASGESDDERNVSAEKEGTN